MKKNQKLISYLEVALIGLASLKEGESNAVKRQEIDEISEQINQAIDLLRSSNWEKAKIAWDSIQDALIKHGVKEIVEAIVESL